MSDSLKELYQEAILDHSKYPRNFGKPENYSREAHGYNPLCGDTVNVYLTMDDDQHIQNLSFDGKGCAISLASASLMTEILTNKSKDDAVKLFDQFHTMITGEEHTLDAGDDTEKLKVLSGVKAFPMRVKCATLSWHALNSALTGDQDITTE